MQALPCPPHVDQCRSREETGDGMGGRGIRETLLPPPPRPTPFFSPLSALKMIALPTHPTPLPLNPVLISPAYLDHCPCLSPNPHGHAPHFLFLGLPAPPRGWHTMLPPNNMHTIPAPSSICFFLATCLWQTRAYIDVAVPSKPQAFGLTSSPRRADPGAWRGRGGGGAGARAGQGLRAPENLAFTFPTPPRGPRPSCCCCAIAYLV